MIRAQLFELFNETAGCWAHQIPIESFPEEIPDPTANQPISPNLEDIFRAFRLVCPNKVKYLIVGQDPYPTCTDNRPDATGLAFAVNFGTPIPRSLRRILRHIYPREPHPTDVTLEAWVATKKILLLNSALTVKRAPPGGRVRDYADSHKRYWANSGFIDAVWRRIRELNQDTRLVAWGIKPRNVLRQLNPQPNLPPVWCYHPTSSQVSDKHDDSFHRFWKTPVGEKLMMQAPEGS